MLDVIYLAGKATLLVDGVPSMEIVPGASSPIKQTLVDAATVNWVGSSGQVATLTVSDNRLMAAPTGLVNGATYSLEVIQDAVGFRSLAWNSAFKWAKGSAPSLSPTPGSRDYFTFKSDGTYLYELARSQGVSGDPLFSQVQLLLNMQGVAGATTIADLSSFSRAIVPTNFTLAKVPRQYGDTTGAFAAGYLTVGNTGDFPIGTDDFCVEAKVYLNDLTGLKPIFAFDADYHLAGWVNGETPQLFASSDASSWDLLSGDTGPLNGSAIVSAVAKKFTDICFQRTGSVWRVFVDGNVVLETVMAGTVTSTAARKLRVGIWGNSTNPLSTMSIQQFRYTSASRYSGPYLPSSAPYPTSA